MLFTVVNLEPDSLKTLGQLSQSLHYDGLLVVLSVDRDDRNLGGRKLGRDNDALVVSVSHDQGPDEPGRHAPTAGEHIFLLALFVLKFHIEGFGELLGQMVRSSSLKGLSVLHHGFDRIGMVGPREFLAL